MTFLHSSVSSQLGRSASLLTTLAFLFVSVGGVNLGVENKSAGEAPARLDHRSQQVLSENGVTDPDAVIPPSPLAKPGVGVSITDPDFGTTLRRLANASENGGYETHLYSQLQAFSADNAYVLLADDNGYLIRRMDNLSKVTGLDTSEWNAPRWQPALSHTLVHYDSNADTTVRVQYTNVDTGQTTTVFTFPSQYDYIRSNQSFDELSRNGRWMAGMAQRNDGEQVIFALDLQTMSLGATLSLTSLYGGPCAPDPVWGMVEPDWVGVSPLGNYLVVQWTRDGTARCSGLETFNPTNGTFIGRVYDGHQHGDLGLLADGVTEMFMTFELYHPSGKLAIGYRLLPGTNTASAPTYLRTLDWFGAHISCQGPAGVCLVTTDADPGNGWQALEGEIFLLYTNGAVNRLTHHRSSSCGYWVQPRGSLSANGQFAIFATDWGADSCSGGFDLGAGDPYVVNLGASKIFTSLGAQDGLILESSESGNTGGTLNSTSTVFSLGDDAADKQFRSILSFYTAPLPDNAAITKVTVKIKFQSVTGTNPFTTHGVLYIDVRNGAFSQNGVLQLGDFQAIASKSAAGAIPNAPVNGWYSRVWTSGIFAYINKAGVTQFRLRFATDDNDDLGADIIRFYSGNAATTVRPLLIVEYYVP